MSNQIVISSGAKVRSLEGVLTGTAGIVNSVPLGGANGVATLDALGKVPLSQLPASVVTYLGTWNAATNTPTLTNGVGDVGDLYICNVAGTVNFGAGPITFAVGDWVIYSGTEWQKSAGASGTVTSVAVTESGDALTITGSPITTSGTINIGFAGTGSQYIKGDGTLATFPTTIDQAKRLITEVYNSTGATLTKGTVVYINGGQGNLPTVTKAQANADNTSAQTYGVVQSDITNNNNGFVVVIGSLTDIDTQAYAVGTQLYLSGTTAGDWTSTKPSAPIHLVYVGIVVRSHPTQGVVEIRIQNGYELEELHDVAISAPVNNQGIFYNSSTDLWENKSIATALGYTPANDALVVHLAGTETITGSKTFSALTAFTFLNGTRMDYGLYLSKGSVPSAFSGSTVNLYSDSGNNNLVVRDNSNTSLLQFQAASSYTYTFPAASGSLALLESTQTFTGDKTFSGDILATNYYRVQQNATLGVAPSGYSTFGAINTKLNFGVGVAVSTQKVFQFETSGLTNNTTRVYTLPDASGTLALTSNLSSYVPYTGATTNVDLGSNFLKARTFYSEGSGGGGSYAIKNGTTPAFEDGYTILSSNDYRLNIVSTVSAATKAVYFGFSGVTATRTYTLPDATGTIALTSNLSSYLPLTGGTLTGALNGTSATFSSSVTANGVMSLSDDGTYGSNYKTLGFTGNTNGNHRIFAGVTDGMFICSKTGEGIFFRVNGGTTNNLAIASTGAATFKVNTDRNLAIKYDTNITISAQADAGGPENLRMYADTFRIYTATTAGGLTERFTISNTGAATFSSSVTANNNITVLKAGSDTAFDGSYLGIGNATNSVTWGWQLGASNKLSLWYYNGGATLNPINVLSSGNVGIGTGSPSQKLEVGGGSTDGIKINTSDIPSLYFYTTGGSVKNWGFAATNLAAGDFGLYQANANGGNPITAGTPKLYVSSDGNILINSTNNTTNGKLYINTTSSSYGIVYQTGTTNNFLLEQNGAGYLRAAAWSYGSDARLKENISYIETGLDKILALKPATFDYIDGVKNNIGWIAQDVQEVIPEAVKTISEDNDQLTLKSDFIIPYLVKAIQELNAKVTALENK